jgi:hypothetical protein
MNSVADIFPVKIMVAHLSFAGVMPLSVIFRPPRRKLPIKR